jgi:hypothetical protein
VKTKAIKAPKMVGEAVAAVSEAGEAGMKGKKH